MDAIVRLEHATVEGFLVWIKVKAIPGSDIADVAAESVELARRHTCVVILIGNGMKILVDWTESPAEVERKFYAGMGFALN